MYRKLDLHLPNLKFVNYAPRKNTEKNIDRDDPSKKADIHKLLPFSKLGQKNTEKLILPEYPKKREEINAKRKIEIKLEEMDKKISLQMLKIRELQEQQ